MPATRARVVSSYAPDRWVSLQLSRTLGLRVRRRRPLRLSERRGDVVAMPTPAAEPVSRDTPERGTPCASPGLYCEYGRPSRVGSPTSGPRVCRDGYWIATEPFISK